MKYDQQCTQCMPKRTFEALSKVIDYMWDDEERNYAENSRYYGDMVDTPRDHIFLEIKRLRKFTSQFLEEVAKSD